MPVICPWREDGVPYCSFWPAGRCLTRGQTPLETEAPEVRLFGVAHYVYVDGGPGFYAKHLGSYPDLERPAPVVNIGWLGVQLIPANGGSCFLPIRMARSLIQAGRLFAVTEAPELSHPAYMVFPRRAVEGLRELALTEPQRCKKPERLRCY